MHGRPMLTKGQGHPKVMIYTNFVEFHCLMLHAKFKIIGLLVLEKNIFKVFVILPARGLGRYSPLR